MENKVKLMLQAARQQRELHVKGGNQMNIKPRISMGLRWGRWSLLASGTASEEQQLPSFDNNHYCVRVTQYHYCRGPLILESKGQQRRFTTAVWLRADVALINAIVILTGWHPSAATPASRLERNCCPRTQHRAALELQQTNI